MIGSLMYLTSSRPDLIYAVCLCARYQAKPTKKHLNAVKRIFRYLKGTINMDLWYSKDTSMSMTVYADANHAGCQDTRRSTSGSAQFLGDELVRWSSKKQKCTAISSTKSEYIALSRKIQLLDRKALYEKHVSVNVETSDRGNGRVMVFCRKIPGQNFEDLPLEHDILSFIRDLGHTGDITYLTDVNVDYLHQPWRAFATVINKCLSGKETGMDKIRLLRAQILWGMFHKKNIDYVYLLWEDLLFLIRNTKMLRKTNNDCQSQIHKGSSLMYSWSKVHFYFKEKQDVLL
ncbi:hypothetical protein Tco_0848516 [Tanacetum coccineum]